MLLPLEVIVRVQTGRNSDEGDVLCKLYESVNIRCDLVFLIPVNVELPTSRVRPEKSENLI